MNSKINSSQIISQVQKHAKDNGSTIVQLSLIDAKIDHLSTHLKIYRNDEHSRRGLGLKVAKRRKLLKYLARKDNNIYLQYLKTRAQLRKERKK